jgi:hypothetical protein
MSSQALEAACLSWLFVDSAAKPGVIGKVWPAAATQLVKRVLRCHKKPGIPPSKSMDIAHIYRADVTVAMSCHQSTEPTTPPCSTHAFRSHMLGHLHEEFAAVAAAALAYTS